MTFVMYLQIAVSFVVGGLFVAFLSLLAERSSALIAGIVLNLPSTLVVAFFFMALLLSPESVAGVLPNLPIALANSLAFLVVYLFVAQFPLSKPLSMLASTLVATCIWFLISVPISWIHVSNVHRSLLVFIFIAFLIQIYFFRQPAARGDSVHVRYSTSEKCLRSLIAGSLIASVVAVSKVASPVWGSILSAFPAANLSALLILHRHYDAPHLLRFCRTAPVGFSTLVVYAMSCALLFPLYGAWLGTLFAYALSLLYVIPIVQVMQFFNARFASPLPTS